MIMNFNTMTVGFSLVSVLAIAGCGSSADDDPLAGTWSNTSCYGASSKPADVESCTIDLTFDDDLAVELKAEWISLAATSTNPGCTTTKLVTGQEWSTDHARNTFTVTGSGEATMERTKCVNETDDMAPVATSDISIPQGETTYSLTGDTLTVLSGSLSGTYTR